MDRKSISKRLQELKEVRKIKRVRAFALEVNADPSFFDKIYKGNADITDNIIASLREKLGVNPRWIEYGETPQYIGSGTPANHVNGANNLASADLIAAKDETIAALNRHLTFVEKENERLKDQCNVSLKRLTLYA